MLMSDGGAMILFFCLATFYQVRSDRSILNWTCMHSIEWRKDCANDAIKIPHLILITMLSGASGDLQDRPSQHCRKDGRVKLSPTRVIRAMISYPPFDKSYFIGLMSEFTRFFRLFLPFDTVHQKNRSPLSCTFHRILFEPSPNFCCSSAQCHPCPLQSFVLTLLPLEQAKL